MKVDVIDIGFGNVGSVRHWLESARIEARIVADARRLRAPVAVLPGVGSAGPYLEALRSRRFDEAIFEHLQGGGRLVGICLGFQVMADHCAEDGGHAGLGLVRGEVRRLEGVFTNNGWHPIELRKQDIRASCPDRPATLTRKRVVRGRVFYNHEYGFVARDAQAHAQPICDALKRYSSIVVKPQLVGMQFHPEKSQATGLDLIRMVC